MVSVISCQKLFTDNREQLIHLFKGITVGTDKFQVTPLSQVCICMYMLTTHLILEPMHLLKRHVAANLLAAFMYGYVGSADCLGRA
jgi:hypothetical protein